MSGYALGCSSIMSEMNYVIDEIFINGHLLSMWAQILFALGLVLTMKYLCFRLVCEKNLGFEGKYFWDVILGLQHKTLQVKANFAYENIKKFFGLAP